jgi:NAD(P)-dependent dehydrogenase (short-subunit alcohol dehydrogenase family)
VSPDGGPPLALVTGASSGIGAVTAITLGRAGWRVILVGRNEARLARTRADAGPHSVTIAADLGDDPGCDAVVRAVADEPLGALVHAAGVVALGSVAELEAEALDRQYRLNVRAPYHLTRALLANLRRAGGHVVFVNSGSGRRAKGGWGAYAASKFALRAVADALREEEPQLRVTTVYPGRTDTPMQRAVFAFEGRTYDTTGLVTPEAVARSVLHVLSSPRPSLVSELDVRPG